MLGDIGAGQVRFIKYAITYIFRSKDVELDKVYTNSWSNKPESYKCMN